MNKAATLAMIMCAFCVTGCTSDPQAPINQSFPIRQMDDFFNSLAGRPPPPPPLPARGYTSRPGYAPAYPPYYPG